VDATVLAKVITDKFIDAIAPAYSDKGLMRTALGYVINNWDSLTAFLAHADLVITNNPAEKSIRLYHWSQELAVQWRTAWCSCQCLHVYLG